ncbi:diguanylate cyclase [Trichlorobacter lovleyi]|uniref:diguanylate cyclase n=1 Tax=Trichlorobacter lovleyi (strain ATCC BAA-1151 / DSM 17278 / SZ) TaxID=398767 RepID=B3E3P3_TRIL1|nr:diguanylate cyclase [Trichlorobacter lovleyi]ACD97315.1 response regulator receiver modulated diguanylate cyclase [Trichlorobacter lovleyi SZ]QOX80575.1 diguanylate cyclase [Trichlorobacter lovleyi]
MADSVLIIDDSEAVREKIIKTLESRDLFSRFYQAEDGLEGFKKLLASPVDIILCDLEMPRMDGFKFLGMLKGRPEVSDTPVIILTGNDDRELKIKGLEQGACDFITKPFDPEELVARMRVHLKIKHLQDDLKRSNELLLELSNTDHLTGLFNRRFLMEALDKEVQRARRKDGQVALLLMDIDHFKRVNDTHGHLQGDVVLQKVALHIQKELRSYDIAARYGGEEFVAVLPDTSLKEAFNVADRIRLSVQGMHFAGSLANERVTVSLGVALFPSPCFDDIDGLLRAADEALYQAKERGRNRVIISDPGCSQ